MPSAIYVMGEVEWHQTRYLFTTHIKTVLLLLGTYTTMMTLASMPHTTPYSHSEETAASVLTPDTSAPSRSRISANPLPVPNPRLSSLPLYVFAALDVIKQEVRASGLNLIDLGMGNPDQPTPQPVLDALHHAIDDPINHGYPSFEGKASFRQAVAGWMQRRYGVSIDPNNQAQPLLGSKEGIANLITAYVEPGSICLTPSLYYPTYVRSTIMAGAEPYYMPLLPENHFLPDFEAIPESVARRAKVLLLNYPNNPTGVSADKAFYEKALAFAQRYNLVVMSDMAYGEVAYDGYRPVSIMECEGANDRAIEFHSFSKTFHMAGWRLGFAVGGAAIIRALYLNKTTIDYGVCNAIQDAGAYALNNAETFIVPMCETYRERRDYLVSAFRELGWDVKTPEASFYLWLKIPPAFNDSYAWVEWIMRHTGVVFTPGKAFGQAGDGYFRVSLVSPIEKLQEAISALKAQQVHYHMH
jgi:LL-diaminopimelate aminotransferase